MLCKGDADHPVSFVRSTRDVLARCMREKGVPAEDAAVLLAGLPATFDEWVRERIAASPRKAARTARGGR
jgi:hypothetical protein